MRSAHLSLNTEAMSFMQNAMRCEWNYYEFLINCRCPGKTLTTLARDTSGKSGKRQATTTRSYPDAEVRLKETFSILTQNTKNVKGLHNLESGVKYKYHKN